MTNKKDPFARPPKRDRGALRLEDQACRKALKAVNVPSITVYRNAGLDEGASLTFDVLVGYAGFPFNPAVSDEPLDDGLTLMTKFESSRLWRAWRSAWADRPHVKAGTRVLVVHGAVTGYTVVYDSPVPPARPHLSTGHGTGTVLRIEPLASWCRGIGWNPSED